MHKTSIAHTYAQTSPDDCKNIVELRGVTHRYGGVSVLHEINLSIGVGEFFTLLGPSGCGKTTLLRIIAGLQQPTTGSVSLDGKDVVGTPPHHRNIGVVFQNLALFPHMTVAENIAFPLKMRGIGREERASRVADVLETVRLPHLESRRPEELSGGQKQRVAIARALVFRPRLLLLDEPLAALDRRLKEEMQVELIRLHRELGVAIVNVTHDQREALRVSDRVGVMHGGKIRQVGTPEELYAQPADMFVAAFLGDPSLLKGTVEAAGLQRLWTSGLMTFPVPSTTPLGPSYLTLRSENLRLRGDRSDALAAGMAVEVELATFEGDGRFYQVRGAEGPVISVFESGTKTGLQTGERGWLSWDPANAPIVPVLENGA